MKCLMHKAGRFRLMHDPECLFPGDHSRKTLSSGMAGGFSKGETVFQRGICGAGVSEQGPTLTTETMPHCDLIEFFNDFLYRLAGENEFTGRIQGFVDRDDFDFFPVVSGVGRNSPVNRGGTG